MTTATNQQAAFNVPFFENWDPNARANKMYQVIENIPNGTYELDICAFVNNFAGDGQTSQYVFANDEKTYLTTGTPTAYKVFVQVTDNRIEVGLEQTSSTANWMGIDNVSLKYYGNCTIAEAQFGSYIATVRELKDKIAAVTALPPLMLSNTTAILIAISDTQSSVEDYEYVIGVLTDLYDSVKESEAVYAEYTNIRNYVTALLAVLYVEKDAGAWDDLDEANMDAATREAAKADERPNMSSIQDIYDAIFNLRHAAFVYVEKADPAPGSQFDITFFLQNPDVTGFWDGNTGIRPDGWLTDQDGGNFQVMQNNEMGPGGEVFMEYWSGTAKTSDFLMYLQPNLPEGTYKATCSVGLLQDDGSANANVTFTVNDLFGNPVTTGSNPDGTPVTVGTLSVHSVEFVNTTEDIVKIGVKAQDGNTYHWIGANNMHLYKIAPVTALTINCEPDPITGEYTPYDRTRADQTDVLLIRNLYDHQWNTLVLPFNMSANDVPTVFGADTRVYYADWFEADANLLHFEFAPPTSGDVILANTPCIIYPTNETPEDGWYIHNRQLVPTDTDTPLLDTTPIYGSEKGVITTGNYAGSLAVPFIGNYGNWVLGYIEDYLDEPEQAARFYYVDQSEFVYLHPTRAYFTVFGATATKAINIAIGDEATGIATVENGEMNFHTGKIYDLSGREVKNPVRGLYIINGKKVMIK